MQVGEAAKEDLKALEESVEELEGTLAAGSVDATIVEKVRSPPHILTFAV